MPNHSTAHTAPNRKIIHSVFESIVSNFGSKTAIIHGESQLTYEELNKLANKLARALVETDLIHNQVVGVFLPACSDYIVSLIGISKAGGIVMPIDTAHPLERLKYILEKGAPKVILVNNTWEHELKSLLKDCNLTDIKCLNISHQTDDYQDVNFVSQCNPDDSNYILFTSGSTGNPKAILGQHKSLSHFIHWEIKEFELGDECRVSQLAPNTFDVSLRDILVPLLSGGTLCIPSPDQRTNPRLLIQWMEDQKLTLVHCVPSLFRLLCREIENSDVPSSRLPTLKHVLLAGEALYGSDVQKWHELTEKRIELVNLYGPSETTLAKIFNRIKETPTHPNRIVPIGNPISNTAVLILKNNRLCSIGEIGEIHIKTPFASKGYYKDPELTSAHFIQNPLKPEDPTDVIYKTGDQGRYLPDRSVEFLGRLDSQIKINGIRLELGELESNIRRCPSIDQSVVIPHQGSRHDYVLSCYYTEKTPISGSELREYLRKWVPEEIIPVFFIRMDEFPLNINGKVDRKALPKPEDLLYQETKYKAPTNPLEEDIAKIWGDILGIKQVGIENSFIELGGDSLKAIRSISRIYQALGIEISLKDFFPHATVAKLAQIVGKQEKTTYTRIPVISDQEHYRSSQAQRRMWILNQMEENPAAYNIPQSLKIDGAFDIKVFEQSLRYVIQKHESLRTTFVEIKGDPHQQIHPSIDFSVQQIDLSENPDRVQVAEELALTHSATHFDLQNGPLLKVTLLKLTETSHVLLFCIHHIICDGWSIGILVKEIMQANNALLKKQSLPDKPLSIQYKDYADWQNRYHESEANQKDAIFWKQTFAGSIPTLQIPTDFPRPPINSFEGDTLQITFDSHLSAAIKRIASQEGASLFMILTALVKVLLHTYSRQEDIIIGTPIAGRNHPDLEEQIGLFINTLALRNQLTHSDRFADVLQRVNESAKKAYEHQSYPFDRLVNDLSLSRDSSRSPLFDVLIVLQNNDIEPLKLDGVTIGDFPINHHKAQFDLTFEFNESDGALNLNLNYKTKLYRPDTISRIIEQFQVLANEVVENPNLPIGQYSLLSTSENTKLDELFKNESTSYETPDRLTEIFERRVIESPDSIAVHYEDETLTYSALNCRANQLARQLQSIGIQPHDIVGLYLERSIEMVVGVLGILKAGAAYLPLDPNAPEERLNLILKDAQAKALVTQKDLQSPLNPSDKNPQLFIDDDHLSNQSTENLEAKISSDAIAYIIYTSGSTGIPKGTRVSHSNVTRLFKATDTFFEFNTQDKWTLFHSIAFDFSVWELWGALLYGGELVVVPYWISRSPDSFHDLIHEKGITVLNQTPSAFYALMQADQEKDKMLVSLRSVIFGGETLTIPRLKPWFDRYGDSKPQLVNMYGITETTVHVTWRPLSKKDLSIMGSRIGIPIPDLQLYVVNSCMQRLPIGVAGELLVGGAGVTQGYLNREQLTHERFIDNPFAKNDNNNLFSKVYRTGDLVRFLEEGDIEYLGRIDQQVQIRGFRVELGEIESVLNKLPDIQQAVVISLTNKSEDQRIIAYYTADELIPVELLRSQSARSLPEYMIPSAFILLNEIPLTANGKVDTRSLPAPEYQSTESAYVAPEGATEELLLKIWQEVLEIDHISVTDNFFNLGGHSLLATQLVSRIREAFVKEISLRLFFQHPSIREQAAILAHEKETEAVIIPAADTSKPLQLSYAQQRLWFIDQYQGRSANYNMPSALRFRGVLNIEILSETLLRIIQRHQSLRTCFESKNGKALQTVLQIEAFELPVINLQDSYKSIDTLISEEAQQPFDLSREIPIRAQCIQCSDTEHVLLLTMHHIASDGWSLGVLTNEVNSIYSALIKGNEPKLKPLNIQYSDFAAWQRNRLSGAERTDLQDWWKNQLSDASELLNLPLDKARPTEQTFNGDVLTTEVSTKLINQLNDLCAKEGVTPFILFETAFALLMHRYSQDKSVVIGTPIANRNYKELEPLIGFFVNTLALHHQFDGHQSFIELLHASKNTTLGAYDHQDLPFELLVDLLQTKRTLSYSPIFQVMFVYQNNPEEQINLPDVTVDFLPITTNHAKFDLILIISENKGKIHCSWEFNTNLFELTTIERFNQHYQYLLNSIAHNPDEKIATIQILPDEEKIRILEDWITAKNSHTETKSTVQLIAEHAIRSPHSSALLLSDKSMTYGELEIRSNQLANYLLAKGLQREDYVGIYLDRSFEMIIAILGVMKSGGAYVPIDPDYPSDRVHFILEDTEANFLITKQDTLKSLTHQPTHPILIDTDWDIISKQPANFISKIEASDLAYLIYTSGSTGRPKGVMVEHRGLTNLVHSVIKNYELTDESCVLQFSSLSFDASVWEIFPTLASGATLQLVERDTILDAELMQSELKQSKITHLLLTPSYLKYIPDELPHLKAIMTAGEACNPKDLKRWLGKVKIFNGYGPTEDTVCTTLYSYESEADTYSIGKPIDNKEVYILDHNLELLPIGVPGELCVGGHGVARGYHNRAEQTQQKFIPNPFGSGRLYRTGDLARWLPDGNLEFLGRMDHQVKIRGFRIELGEIESTLQSIPEIQQSAVIVESDEATNKRLIAYFTATQPIQIEQLRQELKRRLPDYMVPSAFLQLENMPITTNGKIDRKALPTFQNLEMSKSLVAPRNDLEATLLNIWKKVLANDHVGVTDNFFEVGGDSIIAIQLTSLISQAGYRLQVKELFSYPTVAESALCLATKNEQISITMEGESALHPIQIHFFKNYTPVHHFNQSVLLELPIGTNAELLELSLRAVVAHHDVFRTRFTQAGTAWTQTYSHEYGNLRRLDIYDLKESAETEREQRWELLANQLQSSFDLSEGNLIRAAFIEWDHKGSCRLFLCLHHLIVDGVSWRILLEDIQTAYKQLSKNESVSLPKKTSSYQQWTHGLQKYAESERAVKQLKFWKSQLPDHDYCLPSDLSYSCEENTVSSQKSASFELSQTETSALLHEVHSSYHTQINDILLTALSLSLNAWLKRDSVHIELEGHGREDINQELDVSRTVGWFTSLFPLKLQLTNPENLGECLIQTKEFLRNIPDKGIGYSALAHLNDLYKDDLIYRSEDFICFNYWGQLGDDHANSGWSFAKEATGENLHADIKRNNLIDVNCIISNGCFKANIGYATNAFSEKTINEIARSFQQYLTSLIEHCRDKSSSEHTPSDYPLAKSLTIEQLKVIEKAYPELEDIVSLSPLQKGLYFQDSYDNASLAYTVQVWAEIEGKLHFPAFIKAWEHVIAQHSALRASFVSLDDGDVLQIISKSNQLDYKLIDHSQSTSSDFETQLQDLLTEDRNKGFNLAHPSLLRLQLIKKDVAKTVLIISSHHIILDGWSLPIIFREVIDHYKNTISEDHTNLGRIDRYQDYLAWISQQEDGSAKKFWSEQLSGFESITPLPLLTDQESGSESVNSSVNRLAFQLGEDSTTEVNTFCKKHQITANTLFQTAWSGLLSRLTNEDDIVFGATLSGRNIPIPNIESKVGLFINTIPVRISWNDNHSILETLKLTHENALRIQEHSYFPLFEIQNQTSFKAGEELFNSLVVFENFPMDEQLLNEDDEELRLLSVKSQEHTHYPLTLLINPGKNYSFEFSYLDSVYDQTTVKRLSEYLERLIKRILSNPDQNIWDLQILSEGEINQILHEFNDSQNDYPRDASIASLFHEQVDKNPNAIALSQSGQSMTYADLDMRSNQVAFHLVNQGIQSEDLVGIYLDRSFELIIGILGILKAGGAYVPFDPTYPIDRLKYIANHADVKVIITQNSLSELGSEISGARQIMIDNIPPVTGSTQLPETNGDSLTYVMYTSGSTGMPKGISIPQRGMTRLVKNVKFVDIRPEDTYLLISSIAFDASTFQLWAPLLNGAKLALMPPEQFTFESIEEVIQQEKVKVLNITSELFNQMVDHRPSSLQGIDQLLVGGDILSVPHLKKAMSTLPDVRIINVYGPTENSNLTATHPVSEPFGNSIPIGKPVPNTTVYILDRRRNLQPIGVPGELYTGGDGLARGYYKRPELTEEKFIKNPFGEGKLYATGDLTCFSPVGNISFLGRIDQQVKIRGFRIELPEIELTLSAHPAILSAAVVVKRIHEESHILAYIIGHQKSAIPEAAELRKFLGKSLPDYMIPSAFITVDSFPFTPNGKLDRRALPVPQELGSEKDKTFIEPKTPTEKAIAKIWSKVLMIDNISAIHSFFDMGGHSLKAMQIVTQIHKTLGKKIGIRDFFTHPTISQTAAFIDQLSQSRYDDIPVAPIMDSYPLSYPQQRLWLLHNMGAHTAYNMPKAFLLNETVDVISLNKAFTKLIDRHEALRTAFVIIAGEPRQKIISSSQAKIREIDFSGESDPEASARKFAEQDAMTPFSLTHPPHLRMSLLRLGQDKYIILITMHHIIGDGWSMNVFYDEIISLYHAYHHQATNPLKPLRIQYKDFAYWQKSLRFDTAESFWLSQIEGMSEGIRLPYDLTPPSDRSFRGSSCSIDLNPKTTTELEVLASAKNTTLSTVVLSLFKLFLFQLTRQSDLSVGVSIANRSHPDLENLIGFFVNVLPVRTQLTGDEDFNQLLDQVIATTESTYEHQDYPLDLLVQKHNPDRESNRQPLFNIVYGFQNFGDLNIPVEQSEHSTNVSNLHFQSGSPFELEFETSKFDLTLFAFLQQSTLRLVIEYDTELFKESTIQNYLATLKRFAELITKTAKS